MKATSAPRAVAMLAAAGALVLVLEGAAAGQPAKHVLVYGSVVRVDAARASVVVRADGRLISVAAQTASTVISGVPSTVAAVPTSATVLVSGRASGSKVVATSLRAFSLQKTTSIVTGQVLSFKPGTGQLDYRVGPTDRVAFLPTAATLTIDGRIAAHGQLLPGLQVVLTGAMDRKDPYEMVASRASVVSPAR
jgi:hypothetical protein